MDFKADFVAKIKGYYEDSVINARRTNEAWEEIEHYFYDLTGRLKNEMGLLGDYITYRNGTVDDVPVLEFHVKHAGGLKFEKSTFAIHVTRKTLDGQYKNVASLESRAGYVIDMMVTKEFNVAMIDKWMKNGIYEYMED